MSKFRSPTVQLSEEEAARLLVRLADIVDETSRALEIVTDLHAKLAALHAGLTDPVVDLERILRDARNAAD